MIMKNILVPCDFSKPATDAFRYAVDIAKKSGARIHLLNVIQLPVLHDTMLMPTLYFEAKLLEDLENHARTRFQKMAEKYETKEIKIIGDIKFGPVVREIIDYSDKKKIDLIIAGSHGASGLREAFIGSVAEKIVRHASVPVLIVKQYPEAEVKNIVLASSLEMNQKALVRHVKELQDLLDAKLHVVYINTLTNFQSNSIINKSLGAFAKKYDLKNFTLNIYSHPDEEKGIQQFCEKVQADIIAIGTHSRRGISHLINGSLAEDVVNHSPNLVWVSTMRKPTAQSRKQKVKTADS
jgi:nucleotide-binding universal stress UspA family protein